MKKIYALFILSAATVMQLQAQDDLLKMLENENPVKPTPVYATFKSTRVINLQSNETMKAKHLDFRIMHRFQPLDVNQDNVYGLYNLFGLDGAVIRLGFDYGITDKWTIGFGRSTTDKLYDLNTKIKLLEQTKGSGKTIPVSVNYFGNVGIETTEWQDKTIRNYFSSRLSFVNQLVITRKFNDHLSLALVPSFVHYNLVDTKAQPNDIFALGIGGSIKISRSTRFNFEYIPRLNGRNEPKNSAGNAMYYDAFAIGFDIETGGHVFQLHFTNANGLVEQQFIARNTADMSLKMLRFGFNLSRTFSFDNKK
ncbi:MAG: DUF5777 family beta-barrel protein [Bacteroidota bacterium]